MDFERITKMTDKTFAWSISRTFSREEAEELTQEILFQALKSIGQLRDDRKFEPWFWRLADITLKVFKRGKAKNRNIVSINEFMEPAFEDAHDFETDEEYQNLRRRVSQMSASYRDIIVLHYYDGLSCKVISQKLGLPEGTVTYRLSLARNKLKEESNKMNENALKPVKLNIQNWGSMNANGDDIPFPSQYIDDALSQNILWHAYREPKTVEELSELTGVPSYFIEDRIENLIKREAVIQPAKKTIQTDFLIFDEETSKYAQEHSGKIVEEVSEEFYQLSKQLTEKALAAGLQTASRSFDEILCLLSAIVINNFLIDYKPDGFTYNDFRQRYDGWRWDYAGFLQGRSQEPFLVVNRVGNNSGRGNLEHCNCNLIPFKCREIIACHIVDVYFAILQKEELTEKQKEEAAKLIAQGYLKKNKSGEVTCAIPVITKEQHESIIAFAKEIFADLMPLYNEHVKKYFAGYVKLFPKHLQEKTVMERNRAGVFCSLFAAIVIEWVKSGKVKITDGAVCDALIMM